VKSKSEDISGISFIPKLHPECLKNINGNECAVMIIDPDKNSHQLVKSALKHFSFRGENFGVLGASSMKSAIKQSYDNPSLVLVLIDRNKFNDDEVYQYIRFIRDKINNPVCRIVFKDELVAYQNMADNSDLKGLNGHRMEFEEMRGHMISYLREVFISYDKKSNKDIDEPPKSFPENKVVENKLEKEALVKSGLSREKTYSVLAHDLKGPIGSIKILMDVLTTEPELLDKETTNELLLNVRDTAGSIHEMLENFMFWVRVHKHNVHFNPLKIYLKDVVNQTILLLKSSAFNKKIKLQSEIESGITVFADEYMLNTVLRNLMFNAIKFTKEGGEVSIYVIDRGSVVEVVIKDNGIGISEQELTKIFKKDTHFSKQGTAREKGTGFGLILSKDFVEKNGGQLSVVSGVNQGSSFSFTVPKWKKMIAN
jgi:anti-sigma regulatory factor (Ser/Thr protein kinase)